MAGDEGARRSIKLQLEITLTSLEETGPKGGINHFWIRGSRGACADAGRRSRSSYPSSRVGLYPKMHPRPAP